MDAGLRKLWSRQRAKNRPSASALDFKSSPMYEGHVSGPAPRVGGLPLKPSQEKALSLPVGHTKAQSRGVDNFQGLAPVHALGQSNSSGGIKPVLVGISRPQVAKSRSSSRGSLASAVMVAADQVPAGRPNTSGKSSSAGHTERPWTSGTSRTSRTYVSTDQKPKARYIDIFQVTTASQAPLNRFNENVAERNRDELQAALAKATPDYDPTSRYQEEVATRNASMDLVRDSLERAGTSADESLVLPETAGVRVANSNAYIHRPSKKSGSISNARSHETSMSQTTRMYSMNSKTIAAQLPVIPQETGADSIEAKKDHHSTQNDRAFTSGPRPEANVSRTLRPTSTRGPNGGRSHIPYSTAGVPFYKISSGEWDRSKPYLDNAIPNGAPVRSRDSRPADKRDSFHSSSSRGSGLSLDRSGSLPGRMIMDLRGNGSEVFSDSETADSLADSYMESPTLQQAQYSSIYAGQPTLIRSDEWEHPRGETDGRELPSSSNPEFFDLASVNPSIRARLVREEIDKLERDLPGDSVGESDAGEATPRAQPSFSKINTLASVSPGPSVVASQLSNRLDEFLAATAPESLPARNGLLSSAVHSSSARIETNSPPPMSVMPPPDITVMDIDAAAESPTVHLGSYSRGRVNKSPAYKLPTVKENEVQTTAVAEGPTSTISPRTGYALPESLKSNDIVDSHRAFGVHTRDFAVPLDDRGFSSAVQTRRLGLGRHRRIDSDQDDYEPRSFATYVDSKPSARGDSAFDEEDFARKQSEAKEALRRLQESLEADFDTMPLPPRRAPGEFSSYGRPGIPTSVYKQKQRAAPHAEAVERDLAGSVKALTSYHARVTSPSTAATSSSGVPTRAMAAGEVNGASHSELPGLSPYRPDFEPGAPDPVSPGEISLSSFPMPTATPAHSRQSSLFRPSKGRANSIRSMSSTASTFSIPYHMIPGRSSSMRDQVDTFSLDG